MNSCFCYPISDVVEARRGQTHLCTYFSTQPQARRIQAILNKFLSDFGPYLTFKLNRLFWRRRLSFPNLYFSSLFRYLTLGRVSHLQTLYITNDSSEEKPRHFLIYRYITVPYTLCTEKFNKRSQSVVINIKNSTWLEIVVNVFLK